MKKGLVMIVLLLCLVVTSPLSASPLYGGYNGQSGSWIDLFFFGIDDQGRWWVRIPVTLGNLRLNFKYEIDGVISAEVMGQGLSGQGGFRFGVDTSGLTWGEIAELNVTGGFDSNGTTWSEQGIILGLLGTGFDNNGHLWGVVTLSDPSLLSIEAGIDISFLVPEASLKTTPFSTQAEQINYLSLTSLLEKKESVRLIHFLTALSLDDELSREVATLTTHSLDLESLLTFAEEKVFTQERREMVEDMISSVVGVKGIAQ